MSDTLMLPVTRSLSTRPRQKHAFKLRRGRMRAAHSRMHLPNREIMGKRISLTTPMLTTTQKKYLRGLTHDLDPVVMIADKGLSANVAHEIEQALSHHELVKIKIRAARDDRQEWIEQIARSTGAELVQQIGQVACFYRRNRKNPKIALPR